MLEQFIVTLGFSFLLIFCRIGSAIMLMPGFGESYIPPQYRILLGLMISLLLLPILSPHIPFMPSSSLGLGVLVISELFIGLFIGAVCNILMSVTHTAGMIFAYQAGLASAVIYDPLQSSQGSIVGNFMGLLFLVVVFTLNLHHLMLKGLIESYVTFVPGQMIPIQDVATTIMRMVSETFLMATKICSPFIIVGMLLFLAGGVISRLMPTVQVFFLITPVQLIIGFLAFLVSINVMMLASADFFRSMLTSIFGSLH